MTQTLQTCHCVFKCKKKALGYNWVLPHTTKRHCDADQQALLPIMVSAISPISSPATHLSCLESPELSLANQMTCSSELPSPLLVLDSMEDDFSSADYGQANLDEYDFDYP